MDAACARPIAVQTRLTLYWYLRRIGGPWLTVVYNVLNAVLFCILAGCMITVSASAVRIPFGIPPQVHWYPDDLRFVLVVLGVGAVVVGLAMAGFKRLAAFASVCAPWMFLMFIGGALVALPSLATEAGLTRISSVDDFFAMAGRVVWTGRTPDGAAPIGFWQDRGLRLDLQPGDARRAVGHGAVPLREAEFVWPVLRVRHVPGPLPRLDLCAGMMGAGAALLLRTPLAELDSGAVAYTTLGWAGILAVIVAGWTTSNPTLYRAGLALQAVTPNWSRARVTLVAGIVTTIIACFPFVFTRLLDFVGIYGLLLAPAGAVVLTEHWLFPRIGLTRYWAYHQRLALNWPALVAWVGSVTVGLVLERAGVLHLFFLFVPVYLLTIVTYIVLASLAGARVPAPPGTSGIPGLARRGARPSQAPDERHGSGLATATGILAVLALLVCLALPARIAGLDAAGVTTALPDMQQWLILATLVYLAAGTAFYVSRYE